MLLVIWYTFSLRLGLTGWKQWIEYLKNPDKYTKSANDSVVFAHMYEKHELFYLNKLIATYRMYYLPIYGDKSVPLYVHIARIAFISRHTDFMLAGALYRFMLTYYHEGYNKSYRAVELMTYLQSQINLTNTRNQYLIKEIKDV